MTGSRFFPVRAVRGRFTSNLVLPTLHIESNIQVKRGRYGLGRSGFNDSRSGCLASLFTRPRLFDARAARLDRFS